ncbi:MAG: phytanoyl-CoA dioxygenase family protein [Planctomycetaceae bacterium]
MSAPAPTQFKAVLDHEELAKLPRDLSFHPVSNSSPKVLTPEQVEQFNRDGFVKGIRAYSTSEITSIREYFDKLLAKVVAEGGDSYSISSAHLRYGRVWDIVTNARIVACVKDLLGENVVGWGSHFFCKMPGDGKSVAWHQDSSYWPLTPSKAITVWLAVDDADVENACMRFVKGSHHFGAMTFRPSDPKEHNVLNQTIENVEQYGEFVDDCLKAGEISLHSDLLLHGSEANASSRRRCGLTLRYAPVDVHAYMDWNLKGVWVSGSDPSGHWANRSRPVEE